MAGASARTYVFAVEFRIAQSDRIWPVLEHHQDNLVDFGARYVFVYESIVEPGNVLVIIGIRTEQPLLDLLRSQYFFDWFDAVGVDNFPAVFAGETIERFDIGEQPASGTEIVVAAVTPVGDVEDFMAHVRESVDEFARAGIRRTVVYRAFDNPREVMFLQQLADQHKALEWVERSEIAAAWLAEVGIGAYPPVFVGPVCPSRAVRRGEQNGPALMYVCLCRGITNERVSDAVARGAMTTKQVAEACGAGSECGRCRQTIRSIINSSQLVTKGSVRGSKR